MANVKVVSHDLFDAICEDKGWNDNNIPKDIAFISIIGSEHGRKVFNGNEKEHWFKEKHNNVLNVDFDDVETEFEYNGGKILPISEEQSKEVFNFIEKNKGKDFLIHCKAGISRSAAVGRFIVEMYEGYNTDGDYRFANVDVLAKLKRIFREKYHCDFNIKSNNKNEAKKRK